MLLNNWIMLALSPLGRGLGWFVCIVEITRLSQSGLSSCTDGETNSGSLEMIRMCLEFLFGIFLHWWQWIPPPCPASNSSCSLLWMYQNKEGCVFSTKEELLTCFVSSHITMWDTHRKCPCYPCTLWKPPLSLYIVAIHCTWLIYPVEMSHSAPSKQKHHWTNVPLEHS